MCLPIKEGGIGVRNLEEVQSSLFMKFGWNLLTTENLWTKFFKAKYVKLGHVALSIDDNKGSNFGEG